VLKVCHLARDFPVLSCVQMLTVFSGHVQLLMGRKVLKRDTSDLSLIVNLLKTGGLPSSLGQTSAQVSTFGAGGLSLHLDYIKHESMNTNSGISNGHYVTSKRSKSHPVAASGNNKQIQSSLFLAFAHAPYWML
jgi:hypothetical protein